MAANDEPLEDLLRRAVAGEAEALQTLLERYLGFVRLLVRARCRGQMRGRVDSSDLVQETMLRVAQNIGQFQGTEEAQWRGWLARIAEREVIRQLRRHLGAGKRDLTREQTLQVPAGEGDSRLQQWSALQSSPSQALLRQENAILLADALDRLSEDYRELLILRHLQGLSFVEIAESWQRSPGAVRVLWTRALQKLREELTNK